MRGVETKWRRLEDVAKGMETVCGAWKTFCKSGDLKVIFAGLMTSPHPLPHTAVLIESVQILRCHLL